jgi:hypothetical protein
LELVGSRQVEWALFAAPAVLPYSIAQPSRATFAKLLASISVEQQRIPVSKCTSRHAIYPTRSNAARLRFPSMTKLFLPVCLLFLLFSAGCGNGPGIAGITGGGSSTGNYSNASLNGSYVYHLLGTDDSNNASYEESGVFTADGAGHITGGIDDTIEGTGAAIGNVVSGTYSIAGNGTGTISFTGTVLQRTLVVTLVSSSKAYLVEGDALNASGEADLQSASAISTAPTGTFVFRLHTTSAQGSTSSVGQITVNAGVFQSGSVDTNHAGIASTPTLTNFTFNAPIANGRGTGNFTENPGVTSSFNYYIIDATHIALLNTDTSSNVGGQGIVEAQTGGPFSAASFSGNYAFASLGDDNITDNAVDTVGQFTASGGAITAGAFDSVHDGTTQSNVAFTGGSYQVAANGRVTAAFTSAAGTVNKVFWLASPSTAFFVTASDTSDSSLTEDGEADLQQTSAFSTSSINGQFALVMHGIASGVFLDRIGALKWDGAGNLTLNEFANDGGTGNSPGPLTGTYSVAANGRAVGTITSLSNDLVFYMISNTDGFVLQEDSGAELMGRATQQQ